MHHDAGTWTWLGTAWDESNKWTYFNDYRKWSERQHVTIAGNNIYNDTFLISVTEEDNFVFTNDFLGSKSFNKDTHPFGTDFIVSGGSEKVWVTLDSGSYPSYNY